MNQVIDMQAWVVARKNPRLDDKLQDADDLAERLERIHASLNKVRNLADQLRKMSR